MDIRHAAIPMAERKRMALIAHDNCKTDPLMQRRYERRFQERHRPAGAGV